MSWPIRFLPQPKCYPLSEESRYYNGSVRFDKFQIGDLAYFHFKGEPCRDPARLATMNLTAHYFANNADRPPLILALPDYAYPPAGKLYFLVDGQCYSNTCMRCGQGVYSKCKCPEPKTPKGYYDGWTVSGVPPNITVAPSINYDDPEAGRKHYHGFVQNGVVGDG